MHLRISDLSNASVVRSSEVLETLIRGAEHNLIKKVIKDHDWNGQEASNFA